MGLRDNLGSALRAARKLRGLPQEALDSATSRTYMSSLERGLKSPTLDKLDQIANALDLHPLSLIAFCYIGRSPTSEFDEVLRRVKEELELLAKEAPNK
uniref:helix-turn-helix domain-containing protein n=1 Tax=Cupriavidus taiwanensis TaxID=164546 RepID=UPI000E2F0B96|nr:helix-turn-helix transcriptional regulator [Cupriavidus taiwanensis]